MTHFNDEHIYTAKNSFAAAFGAALGGAFAGLIIAALTLTGHYLLTKANTNAEASAEGQP